MIVSSPPRVSLAQLPTPLQPLNKLQQQIGGPKIWLKRDDMTGATLSGNKVRKLEFLLGKALAEGYQAVVTSGGLQSNHCRATAIAAAQLGLNCHLILRGEPDSEDELEGNLFLDKLAGASISFHPVREFQSSLDELFDTTVQRFAERGQKALVIPTGGSNGTGVWGYLFGYRELLKDFERDNISPHTILCATGSGGTQAGLVAGAALNGNRHKIIGINVCDDENYFRAKVAEDIAQWQQAYGNSSDERTPEFRFELIDGYVGAGYGKASDQVLNTIAELARVEGIFLDPVYTGKAFNGLLTEIANGRFKQESDIVFVHTGGVFGLFPFASQLSQIKTI